MFIGHWIRPRPLLILLPGLRPLVLVGAAARCFLSSDLEGDFLRYGCYFGRWSTTMETRFVHGCFICHVSQAQPFYISTQNLAGLEVAISSLSLLLSSRQSVAPRWLLHMLIRGRGVLRVGDLPRRRWGSDLARRWSVKLGYAVIHATLAKKLLSGISS